MLTFNNTHLFTGYLKQLLSSVTIPSCKIYTNEFAMYKQRYGKEDPRIIRSFDAQSKGRIKAQTNYILNNEVYSYIAKDAKATTKPTWVKTSHLFYMPGKDINNFTRKLYSPGVMYDTTTHEYLGDYLRFLRDYHNVNLMSLYNCFNNNICTNINLELYNGSKTPYAVFNSQDTRFTIYAIPVKLFAEYTIAIDSTLGIELCCGFYNTTLDDNNRAYMLSKKTYQKINQAIFKHPFVYNKLKVDFWDEAFDDLDNENIITRYDIINREQDLRLFIKVPSTCRSSIAIIEGDFRHYNDASYQCELQEVPGTLNPKTNLPYKKRVWTYKQNHCIVNKSAITEGGFKPIHKLQLLALNTKESYPFADRLIEYLCGSAITAVDPIADNVKRAQEVMRENGHYFKIPGIWEDKMQKIVYDYVVVGGGSQSNGGSFKAANPVSYQEYDPDTHELVETFQLVGTDDLRTGLHKKFGYTSKSTMYDLLGYIDKDAERIYASWKLELQADKTTKQVPRNNILNVDIYNGLYDI